MATTETTVTSETAAKEREKQAAVEWNLREILSIPFEACPWPAVRNALIQRVLSGVSIKVYAFYSETVFRLEDHTYDEPWMGSPREWAIKNGYTVEE